MICVVIVTKLAFQATMILLGWDRLGIEGQTWVH